MTVIFFAIVIALAALTQRSDIRFFASLAYSIVNLSHALFIATWVDGGMYFVTAGVANLLIAEWLVTLNRITDTVVSLLRVCVVELVVNATGGIIWWNGYDGGVYAGVYVGIYAWVVLILLRKDTADDGRGYQAAGWGDYLRLIAGTGGPALQGRG